MKTPVKMPCTQDFTHAMPVFLLNNMVLIFVPSFRARKPFHPQRLYDFAVKNFLLQETQLYEEVEDGSDDGTDTVMATADGVRLASFLSLLYQHFGPACAKAAAILLIDHDSCMYQPLVV